MTTKPTLPADATPDARHYFSNGTEHEMWSARWCETCEHDTQGDCPLILGMMCGYDLPEIVDVPDRLPPGHLTCSSYTPIVETFVTGVGGENP